MDIKDSITKLLKDKTILVTGGTGSFGNKLIKTVLDNYPVKKVIVYSRDELKQYEIKLFSLAILLTWISFSQEKSSKGSSDLTDKDLLKMLEKLEGLPNDM